MENLELAREFFKGDRFQQRAGVEIEEVSNSHSVCVIRLTPDHFNADGVVQGGVIYTLAESAFAIAANTKDFLSLTLSASIQYISKAKGEFIRAKANLVSKSKRVSFFKVDIFDENDALIATANMTGYIKPRV